MAIAAMAEPACDKSPEECLSPQEPESVDRTTQKLKKPRCRSSRRRRNSGRGREVSFATYFPRVLKQVHVGLSLSQMAVNVMDSFIKDMFERIASEAGRLARQNNRTTITSREIQTAVRLLLPGEINKHAVSEGTMALLRRSVCVIRSHIK
uniref:Core Histone H2A/H2B/H3 domain-containing protein n=1 Tax=Sciurus vulgaris TaxID=55149 RepID=A0A8D2DL83_SCIVU